VQKWYATEDEAHLFGSQFLLQRFTLGNLCGRKFLLRLAILTHQLLQLSIVRTQQHLHTCPHLTVELRSRACRPHDTISATLDQVFTVQLKINKAKYAYGPSSHENTTNLASTPDNTVVCRVCVHIYRILWPFIQENTVHPEGIVIS